MYIFKIFSQKNTLCAFAILFHITHLITAQIEANEKLWSEIKNEGLSNSQAMQTLSEFTDVYGPRLTGSREYLTSAKWIASKMKDYGLENITLEPFCEECRGWSLRGFNVEMTEPNYMKLIAYPLAMSRSTKGVISGEAIHVPNMWKLDEVKEKFKGKLKNKIVLVGYSSISKDLNKDLEVRFSGKQLDSLEGIVIPKQKSDPVPKLLEDWLISDRDDQAFLEFVESEGALAVFNSTPSIPGVLRVEKTFYFLKDDYQPLPYFNILPEHFARLLRMMRHGVHPRIKLYLDTEVYHEPKNNVNILAEIPGSDNKLRSEVVLAGGHFDSWHSSTGATDNAASIVVLLEAMRILKTLDLKPKRTIRIGFWGGEEQAYYGSIGYAEKHFGPLEKPNEKQKKVAAYFNLDNGAGLIRGLFLQENERARPFFEEVLNTTALFEEMTLTLENKLYTDHIVFDHYNIPSFQFIQDDLAFQSMTLHTNMDVYDYVPKEDVLKNACLLAWTLYQLGLTDKKIPKKG